MFVVMLIWISCNFQESYPNRGTLLQEKNLKLKLIYNFIKITLITLSTWNFKSKIRKSKYKTVIYTNRNKTVNEEN